MCTELDPIIFYMCPSQSSVDVFYRKVRFWGTEGEVAPPIFHLDGITYFHVKVRISISGPFCLIHRSVCSKSFLSIFTRTHFFISSRPIRL